VSGGRFVTAVNCMDGRTQLPVNEWLRRTFGADFVDTVTEPGPVRALAVADDQAAVESIRRRVQISVEMHDSTHVAVVAHHDCAGNPVDEATQLRQLAHAAARVREWGLGISVELLWVGEDWQVERVG
jgi:carbonic anhydrase